MLKRPSSLVIVRVSDPEVGFNPTVTNGNPLLVPEFLTRPDMVTELVCAEAKSVGQRRRNKKSLYI